MAPVDPTAISPYLLNFLLGKPAVKEEDTTVGLMPGSVDPALFKKMQTDPSGSYRLLSGAANAIQSKRADADVLYSIKLQKKQQREAELIAKKKNDALLRRIKELTKNQSPGAPPNPYNPSNGGPSNYIPPKPPRPNSDPSLVLPEIAPKPPEGKGPADPGRVTIREPDKSERNCPGWKRLLGLC